MLKSETFNYQENWYKWSVCVCTHVCT